jgi:drug/metabolite transporter (DMT)-like permease
MTLLKMLMILLIGLVLESTGVVLLKKGMTQVGDIKKISVSEVVRVMKSSVKNSYILLGIFFEALFFGCLLILMSRSNISFLWPLTGLSFVFATFAAVIFLHEHVSTLRWVGVILIVFGAALITWSEKAKAGADSPAPAALSTDSSPR